MHMYMWNPWSIFDGVDRSTSAAAPSEWPQFEIEDTEDATLITVDLPGMTEDDVEVTLTAPHLIVRGERKARDGGRTRTRGAFERRFRIADGYDPERVTATLANGELTIRLVKAASAKPRRIKVGGGGLAAKIKGVLAGDKDKESAA
jgi:HSP20 family protein